MIRTFLFDFHMGSEECVTCHVPESHSIDGATKEVGGAMATVGGRRTIGEAMFELYSADSLVVVLEQR